MTIQQLQNKIEKLIKRYLMGSFYSEFPAEINSQIEFGGVIANIQIKFELEEITNGQTAPDENDQS